MTRTEEKLVKKGEITCFKTLLFEGGSYHLIRGRCDVCVSMVLIDRERKKIKSSTCFTRNRAKNDEILAKKLVDGPFEEE
jgi:hypothetical protein